MFYLRFTHIPAYVDYLKALPTYGQEFNYTHFDVADISTPRGDVMFSAVATQRIGADCIAVCHEVVFQEPAEAAEAADRKDARAHARKIEKAVWRAFSARERAVKDAGLIIRRGILTTEAPEILQRAK